MTGPELRNVALKERHPRLDDPAEAIRFVLSGEVATFAGCFDFLQCWSEGAWNEIEQAYPEYLANLEQVETCK